MSEWLDRIAMALHAKNLRFWGTTILDMDVEKDWHRLPEKAKNFYREYARAAGEAAREPTEEMASAAIRATVGWLNLPGGTQMEANLLKAKHRFRAMIDEGLK